MRDPKQSIEILRARISEVEDVAKQKRFSPQFKKWQRDTSVAIRKAFGKDCNYAQDFENISYGLIAFTTSTPESRFDEAFQDGLRAAVAMLESMIDELETYEPETKETAPEMKSKLSGIELGVIVTLLLAIAGGIYKFAEMNGRLNQIASGETVKQIEGAGKKAIGDLEAKRTQLISEIDSSESMANLSRLVPVGTVVAYAGDLESLPESWMHCDGRPLSRKDYSKLFDVLGVSHGRGVPTKLEPDSKGDFNIPDYLGRFLRGVDFGTGRDPDVRSRVPMAEGGNSKAAVGSVQEYATARPKAQFSISESGKHTHTYAVGLAEPGQGMAADGSKKGDDPSTSEAGGHTHTISGGDSETRPLNAGVQWIIRAK